MQMNSNCSQLRITPFRLFDAAASRDFKRRMATQIQSALQETDLDQDYSILHPLEDAVMAQHLIAAITAETTLMRD
jgi:hypothetical protein